MSDSKFHFNSLWRCFSQTGNETLSLSVYAGNASLVIFKKGTDSKKPAVRMNLPLSGLLKMGDILKSLLDAQPGTRSPYVQMNFDKDTRAYEQATSFVFYKDDKRCYGVEVSNKYIPTPLKFAFKCPSTFSTGSEPLSDETKSVLALRELIKYLVELVPEAMLLSRLNQDTNNFSRGGNNNGNNNYRRNNGGQSSQNRNPDSSYSNDDDAVFG